MKTLFEYKSISETLTDRIASEARKRRIAMNLKQGDAAFQAGCSIKTVQAVESGKNQHSENLFTYLAFLGMADTLIN